MEVDPTTHEAGTDTSTVSIIDGTAGLGDRSQNWLADLAARAMNSFDARGEVRVRIVNDAEMSAAHKEYLDIEGTTDVLTFDMSEPASDGSPVLDVDILVCLDEAKRQGSARGHIPERELLLYIVHGVLHCLGYDDHDEEQFAAMHAREDEILRTLGVGDTFDSQAGPGSAP